MPEALNELLREGKLKAIPFLIDRGFYWDDVISVFPSMSVVIDSPCSPAPIRMNTASPPSSGTTRFPPGHQLRGFSPLRVETGALDHPAVGWKI